METREEEFLEGIYHLFCGKDEEQEKEETGEQEENQGEQEQMI